MKALAEEKLYWQNEAFKARDLVEKHAAATRNARDEIGVKVATIQRDQVRLNHATDLIKTLARMAGVDLPAMNLTTIGPEYLADIADIVTREEKERSHRAAPPDHEYFHVAWYGNGGPYMDARKLTREDAVKNRAIFKPGGKVKLYARVPK
jgi:pyruvate/2-oxoglutarate dehydrogenase complex dihydrolipoamide acyltransferase (E2) component